MDRQGSPHQLGNAQRLHLSQVCEVTDIGGGRRDEMLSKHWLVTFDANGVLQSAAHEFRPRLNRTPMAQS